MKNRITEITTTLAIATTAILGWAYLVSTLASALAYPVA